MKKFKISFNSPLILGFALICFIATLLNVLTKGASNHAVFSVWHSSLTSPMTYVRFFTHIFGHTGWEHFIGNMAYILLLGPMLEEKYGKFKIIEVMIITALVTGILNYIFFPSVELCGASGVVFAFILLTSFTSFKQGELPVTVILVAVIFIGKQIYEGIFVTNNVSNLSHIIGGIVGGLIGYAFNKVPAEPAEK